MALLFSWRHRKNLAISLKEAEFNVLQSLTKETRAICEGGGLSERESWPSSGNTQISKILLVTILQAHSQKFLNVKIVSESMVRSLYFYYQEQQPNTNHDLLAPTLGSRNSILTLLLMKYSLIQRVASPHHHNLPLGPRRRKNNRKSHDGATGSPLHLRLPLCTSYHYTQPARLERHLRFGGPHPPTFGFLRLLA